MSVQCAARHCLEAERLAPTAGKISRPRATLQMDIANVLHLSPKTAANMRYLIEGKLGVGSDIELVRLALRQGILVQAEVDGAERARGRRHESTN
jgi:hypothetical protein